MKKIGLGLVLIISALLLGFNAYQMIMLAVWGVPSAQQHYLAFYASLLLLIAGIITMILFNAGRIVALIALLGMGVMYIPASAFLVPAHNSIVTPMAWILMLLYFVSLASVLILRPRFKINIPVFFLLALVSVGFAGEQFYDRWQDGEYQRPSLFTYKWTPSNSDLQVDIGEEYFSDSLIDQLNDHGINGQLMIEGVTGNEHATHKVFVICQSEPVLPKKLYYPKDNYLVYLYDGEKWSTFPHGAQTYDSYAMLETSSKSSYIKQKTDGGETFSLAFSWN